MTHEPNTAPRSPEWRRGYEAGLAAAADQRAALDAALKAASEYRQAVIECHNCDGYGAGTALDKALAQVGGAA